MDGPHTGAQQDDGHGFAVGRRRFAALVLAGLLLPVLPAQAKDDDGGDDGGSDNSGSGSSGSSGNSGSDDSDSDDNDDGNDDNDKSGKTGSDDEDDDDHERARDAVAAGRILPLKDVLRSIDRSFGKVVSVELRKSGKTDIYRLKLKDARGTLRTLRFNARTGKRLSLLGF